MGSEIERKFLVRDRSVLQGVPGTPYRQGYLSTDAARTVRVRRAGERGFVTIKGASDGPSRAEYEYEIPAGDADEMLERLALRPLVEKRRHRLDAGGLTWEIDVFEADNAGLVLAEIELPSADHVVKMPAWVGEEVTDDPRYANANLVAHPFREWRA
ncbi:MAG TPA: CYTH domain-containing protein [Candidatus Limnocylindrales bacterium]